eukprot:CAMPEP_0114596692 /NCGR_PEP_ID=MMETSP0125-20121206/18827_1 /TAXON_ID=485358 ORGANISM="Aristerostoma sp., Strain ATCC 50986" /NCGR_SAMPLE_ID=MMETSP0125 /ASSEMBLY_ACC=CAM_ASM_000245 /LENGTH=124 /DNA_ID=CAMNT_0001800207 /DNA_START=1025 /DNA_END=1395 /DNA_ORIENTATION=+
MDLFDNLDNGDGKTNSPIEPKRQISKGHEMKQMKRIVGTPDYMAPEIIKLEDCSNKAIDFWSLGVILYEMLVGIPPFNDESVKLIHQNILNNKIEWDYYSEDGTPFEINPDAVDLIKKLLNPNP